MFFSHCSSLISWKNIDWSRYWDPRIFLFNAVRIDKKEVSHRIARKSSQQSNKAPLVQKSFRIKAVFKSVMDLNDFPFDYQVSITRIFSDVSESSQSESESESSLPSPSPAHVQMYYRMNHQQVSLSRYNKLCLNQSRRSSVSPVRASDVYTKYLSLIFLCFYPFTSHWLHFFKSHYFVIFVSPKGFDLGRVDCICTYKNQFKGIIQI